MECGFLLEPIPDWSEGLTASASMVVRPILEQERYGFGAYMQRYHYLGERPLVGESLRYGAWLDGELVALLSWATATLHNASRDRYVGWDETARRERLALVVNNARFLILPWALGMANLASRVLSANLRRLSRDWESSYCHPVLLAETFVDTSRFRGTCYRASNWIYVGHTKGWSRRGSHYYRNDSPKAVFVYPLVRRACRQLCAPVEHSREESKGAETMQLDIEKLALEGKGGLFDVLATISDKRKRRGIRFSLQGILAMAICAVLTGQRGFTAITEWAKDQSKETLKRLGSRYGRPPSERTFRRVLKTQVDVQEVDEKIGGWMSDQQKTLKGQGVAIDGKTLRGSRDGEKTAVHLLSALVHGSAVVVAQTQVPGKTNEIKCVKPLFDELEINGVAVTADALLTQKDIARYLVDEKKADYLFTVKDNQPTLREDIEFLFTEKERQSCKDEQAQSLGNEAFPPGAPNNRQGPRSD